VRCFAPASAASSPTSSTSSAAFSTTSAAAAASSSGVSSSASIASMQQRILQFASLSLDFEFSLVSMWRLLLHLIRIAHAPPSVFASTPSSQTSEPDHDGDESDERNSNPVLTQSNASMLAFQPSKSITELLEQTSSSSKQSKSLCQFRWLIQEVSIIGSQRVLLLASIFMRPNILLIGSRFSLQHFDWWHSMHFPSFLLADQIEGIRNNMNLNTKHGIMKQFQSNSATFQPFLFVLQIFPC
jgi:hypothetical protein